MKKQFTSSVFKSIFTATILAFFLSTSTASAADEKTAKTAPYQLKYVGKLEDQPVFQLDIENLQKEEVIVRLEDEVGNVLYTEKFSDKNFSKRFQFDISDANGTKIKMSLLSKTVRQTQVFKISSVQQLIENVVVTKLD